MGHHPAAVYAVADRLAQPEGERAQILVGLDTKRACLRAARLHQDVAQPEAGLLDDVLEHNRLIALGGERADVGHVDRLGNARDDVGIAGEKAAQRRIERLSGRRRPVADGERHRNPPFL